jgi:hypothetical protein
MKVKGKLIRRSLKTKTPSVAKLRLSDFEKDERKKSHPFIGASSRKNNVWGCCDRLQATT